MINVLAEAVKRIKSAVHRKPSAKPIGYQFEVGSRSFLYYLKPGSAYKHLFAEIKDLSLNDEAWEFTILSETISRHINDLENNLTYVIQIEDGISEEQILNVKTVKIVELQDNYRVNFYK